MYPTSLLLPLVLLWPSPSLLWLLIFESLLSSAVVLSLVTWEK